MFRSFFFIFALLGSQLVVAQTITLEQAVAVAIDKSLAVEQGTLQMKGDEISLYQAKMAQYPNLSAGTSLELGEC